MLHAYSNPFNLKDQILSCYKLLLCTATWGRAHTTHGKQPSSRAASGSQLAAPPGTAPSAPPFPTEHKLGHGMGSRAEPESSCLASGSQGSRTGDYSDLFCLGLVGPSVILRCQAGGCWMLPMTYHSHILCERCFDLPCGNEAWTIRAGSSKDLYFA